MQCISRRAFLSRGVLSTPRFFSSAQKTVLDNGITVITPTQPTAQPLSSIGVYVNTGSATETFQNHGCSHYLRRHLFTSTNRTSALRLTRTVETLSATFEAENTPEYLSYKATTTGDNVEFISLLLGDILRPRLAEWEFREVRNLVKHDVNERAATSDNVLDRIRHTAYGGVGLGRSPLCPSYNIGLIFPENVAEYVLGHVIGSNITVVADVADPQSFAQSIEAAFPLSKDSSVSTQLPVVSRYVGGTTLASDGPGSVYAEAYKGPAYGTKAFLALRVLSEVLGSYTSNGYVADQVSSRLAKNLSSSYEAAHTFVFEESQSLLGVQAYGNGPVSDLAEGVHQQLTSLASGITEEEFVRAKNLASARSTFASAQRRGALDALYKDARFGSASYDQVTIEDVQAVAKEVLSSRPTIYASGDLSNLPSFVH